MPLICYCCCHRRPPSSKLLLMKVPNLIKVDPQPYDPATTELEPEMVMQNGKRQLRPNDINVVRWRYRCACGASIHMHQ
jgi:hypothetical protein